ncbi:MAG TPA: ribosome maturation factor [Flavipsychrobacter sp.]|mgnify:CR=1 FL=1|nr:ribosome maturation factor [Flavipsychrobacter sp.]
MTDILLKIEALITPLLEGTDMFVVTVKMKPTNNLKVFLDADAGLSIGKISQINKKLYALIEESQLFPDGDFSLEVSSPGVDEPLTSIRQYTKNIGRTVAIVFNEEAPEKVGVLKEVLEDSLLIESKINKKKETETVVIPFSAIKTITVQIVF